MVEGVQTHLIDAIKVRLRADVPLGIYLSGGIDSSAVAGMVAHLVKEEGARLGNDDSHILSRIKCFTVQFDKDSGADESGMDLSILCNLWLLDTKSYQTLHSVLPNGSVWTFTQYPLPKILLSLNWRTLSGIVNRPCLTQTVSGGWPWPR